MPTKKRHPRPGHRPSKPKNPVDPPVASIRLGRRLRPVTSATLLNSCLDRYRLNKFIHGIPNFCYQEFKFILIIFYMSSSLYKRVRKLYKKPRTKSPVLIHPFRGQDGFPHSGIIPRRKKSPIVIHNFVPRHNEFTRNLFFIPGSAF
jgi:hypothetical protein